MSRTPTNSGHVVGSVRSTVATAPFIVYRELPIPWDAILTRVDLHILNIYHSACVCPARIEERRTEVILGTERWRIHCHCDNENSLKCIASAKLMRGLIRNVIAGTGYNSIFSFYRPYVNRVCINEMYYVGSVMYGHTHLIYIRFQKKTDAMTVFKRGNLGQAVHVRGSVNNYVILICRSCASMKLIAAKCCAKRTRRLIRRNWSKCAKRTLNKAEVGRQRLLNRFIKHEVNFSYEGYNAPRLSS
ncbi:E4 34K [Tree shrew adenovirus 1]|uniref:E4 34K n=1 Tax=Tree shrew adenovirus serotype 1 TaxID=47680 RepID=A0A2U9AG97_ADET1|nr:E4 34K [Tree shrew adenovirus 1]